MPEDNQSSPNETELSSCQGMATLQSDQGSQTPSIPPTPPSPASAESIPPAPIKTIKKGWGM